MYHPMFLPDTSRCALAAVTGDLWCVRVVRRTLTIPSSRNYLSKLRKSTDSLAKVHWPSHVTSPCLKKSFDSFHGRNPDTHLGS
ncbi:hypothetical protein Pint_07515 [Pistacia integerrima]|uniref:Uncharacterized protein n=1 Tax=Pistacia integerrima TaxID=434235 RepID=A0ACC0XRZ0_9ROSI|nr:hypothetical protein Pint_07515 [Pistacia integerrima]